MGSMEETKRMPPRWLVAAADWSNIIAGVTLVVPFAMMVGTCTFKWFEMTGCLALIFQVLMAVEGLFWALGGALMVWTCVIRNDDAYAAVAQTVITFGGIFLFLNGLFNGTPGKAISFGYVLDPRGRVQFTDSSPYYGTACFMTGTAMGLRGAWHLPKGKFLSTYWAAFCMWFGSWNLGLALWLPMILDGLATYTSFKNPDVQMYSQKTFAWSYNHLFQTFGACSLTVGAVLFAITDDVIWCRPAAAAAKNPEGSNEDLELS